MKTLILLFLPALASCSISINIFASNSIPTSAVNFKGADSNVISDKEQVTFGVTEENLKNAAKIYSGGKPKDVFLHSPTPWNDLYQTYGWREVKRVLKPVRSRILDVKSEDMVVSKKEMVNNSTATVIFDTGVTQDVENSVHTTWMKGGALTVQDPVSYSINFTLGSVTGPEFEYTSPFGKDAIEVKHMTIGADSEKGVPVEPGKRIKAELTVTKVTIVVEIDYSASLNGHVACNYPKKYNGHHFWRYDIYALQEAGKLPKSIKSSEVLKIKYYYNPKMVITNTDTKQMVSSIPAFMRVKMQ